MSAKTDVEGLLSKGLGKEVAQKILVKMDEMVEAGKSPAQIEKAIATDLVGHIQKKVVAAVESTVEPLVDRKINIKINRKVAPKVTPTVTSIRVLPHVDIRVQPKVSPGSKGKGKK